MFTVNKTIKLEQGKCLVQASCLQADNKPTIYANGSSCIEMDTSTMYFFDEESKLWRAWA